MAERRKADRRQTSDYFICYDSETDAILGRVIDLTSEGAMMISDRELQPGKILQLRIGLPTMIQFRHFVTVDAEVRWCQYNKRSDWHEIGLHFPDINDQVQEVIESLIDEWFTHPRRTAAYPKS